MSWQAAADPLSSCPPGYDSWRFSGHHSSNWCCRRHKKNIKEPQLLVPAGSPPACPELPSFRLSSHERLSRLHYYQQSTIPNWWSRVTGQALGTGLWELGAEMAAWHCQVPISSSQRSLWPSLCSEQGLEASGDNMTLVAKSTLFGVWTSLGWKPALPPTICGLGKL